MLFHHKPHSQAMGGAELRAFLTHLAVQDHVATSTQNQALNAVVFLYRDVLKQDLGVRVDAVRAKRLRYLPTVLTKPEAIAILIAFEFRQFVMPSG